MELIIVGFHRSGTSLLAQLLHASGLFVGDDLLEAMPSNPFGHFEDREVLELHRRILDDNGVGWQVGAPAPIFIGVEAWEEMRNFVAKRQAEHLLWGFKEPRVCLFLGAWKYLMPEAKFVVVYRDPSEAVRSLHARHASDYLHGSGPADSHLRFFREPDLGLHLWDTHNRAIVNFVKRYPRDCMVMPYSQLVAGYPVVERINTRFRAGLEPIPTEAVFDAAAVGKQESLRTVHDVDLEKRIARTWLDLETLATRTSR